MADRTKIEWTDTTWNPVTGCTKVSPGCDHCYAERIVTRFKGPGAFATVIRSEEKLYAPLKWRKPRRVFVNSMSDLFHDDIPDGFIANVFSVMARTPQHTYQVLTKRPGRMRSLLTRDSFATNVRDIASVDTWPLPNVWLGVSVEDQKWADVRIPALLETPAAVRWLSCEPLLGPVDPTAYLAEDLPVTDPLLDAPEGAVVNGMERSSDHWWRTTHLDWVVVGGESGPGARPMHPDWARILRDQCVAARVPYFFKQWGEHLPARVEDDPEFAGGRAFDNPRGGRSAAIIKPTPDATIRRGTARLMEPGEATDGGVLMLDRDTVAVRVGKTRAGRELDGRTWDEYPDRARLGSSGSRAQDA